MNILITCLLASIFLISCNNDKKQNVSELLAENSIDTVEV